MKTLYRSTLLLVIVSQTFFSCMSVAPVNQHYERAGTLGKGNIEASGSISGYASDGSNYMTTDNQLNKNYGFRIGYGLSDKLDLKLRYEKRIPFDTSRIHTDYFSIIPKFSIHENRLAILAPISRYQTRHRFEGKILDEVSYSFAPQLIRTYTNPKNNFDFSIAGKADFLFHNRSDDEFFLGFNMGAGVSTNLDRWAIRPEVGYLIQPFQGNYAWSYGIGLQFSFPGFRRK
jgi:hypothetical protein